MPQRSHIATNLASLCRDYPSISGICRAIRINRQQFNKYLAGTVAPSPFNLTRICAFFRVTEQQIELEPDEFERSRRARVIEPPVPPPLPASVGVFDFPPDEAGLLDRYLGYYFTYYRSPSFPGSLFKSIVKLYKKDGFVYSKGLERYNRVEQRSVAAMVGKEHGAVPYTDDRIYIAEKVNYIRKSFSLTALYPTYRGRLDLLSGVFMSVSSGAGRQPFTSRVVYEYMGPRPNLRALVRQTGIYPADSAALREDIREKCRNGLDDGILRAIDY